MFPRSGGEKVYLEAAYRHPRLLTTVVFSTQAILLGFTGVSQRWNPIPCISMLKNANEKICQQLGASSSHQTS